MLAFAQEGASQREIAEAVFGDARYRGRVERILRAEEAASNASPPPRNTAGGVASAHSPPESDLELFRELIGRAEQALLESDEAPSLGEIDRLMRIKRQLDALETIEWARRLARGEDEPRRP